MEVPGRVAMDAGDGPRNRDPVVLVAIVGVAARLKASAGLSCQILGLWDKAWGLSTLNPKPLNPTP